MMSKWSLFSNHGHVLVCLANNQQARLRDVAAEVGITERAVQNILREMQDSGVVQINKHGRCNHYQINTRKNLSHPLVAHFTVGQVLQLLKSGEAEKSDSKGAVEQMAQAKSQVKTEAKSQGKTEAKIGARTQPESQPKILPATQPKTQPDTLDVSKAMKAESVPAEPERPPVAKTEKVEPAKEQAEETKASKNTDKERKKKLPPGDQQGSLF